MTSYVQHNPTMATASMTMASQSMDQNSCVMSVSIDQYIESREESIGNLKSDLLRYARSNDRRMVLRCLKDARFLSYVPLEAAVDQSGVPMSELEKEVSQEKVRLNDILLNPRNPSETKNVFANSGTNRGCIHMVKSLAEILCEDNTLDENTLYGHVLGRLAKKSASAEVYFQINSMMGSTALTTKELSSENTAKISKEASDLKLYNSGGQIHMILETTFNYGLFREKDAIINRPWVILQCNIHERANLSTGESFRSLNVKTPSLY